MICVIDYGMGNLRSVSKAIEKLGGEVRVSDSREELFSAQKVVLPGVGAFGDGVSELKKRGLFEPLRAAISKKKPFLGICLGMQLLFQESEESTGVEGLGIFKGKVQRFRDHSVKVPHMGWNSIKFCQKKSRSLDGIEDGSFFYFVHSFYPVTKETSMIAATCTYGKEVFPALIENGSVWASQFHPEKSQDAGLRILRNFVRL